MAIGEGPFELRGVMGGEKHLMPSLFPKLKAYPLFIRAVNSVNQYCNEFKNTVTIYGS